MNTRSTVEVIDQTHLQRLARLRLKTRIGWPPEGRIVLADHLLEKAGRAFLEVSMFGFSTVRATPEDVAGIQWKPHLGFKEFSQKADML